MVAFCLMVGPFHSVMRVYVCFQQKIIMSLWRKQAVKQMVPGVQSLSGMTPNTTAVAPMGHTPSCVSVKGLCSVRAD